MATKDPLVISRAWCSMFKMVENPNTTDILNSQTKLKTWKLQVNGFFESLHLEINPRIIHRSITRSQFSSKYLLVLGQISKELCTCIYMKEILEEDDLVPKRQLIITGYTPEVIFINYFANYLLHMMDGLNKTNQHLADNGRQRRAEREKEFLMPLYKILTEVPQQLSNLSSSQKENLKNRVEKMLHKVFNMFKFDNYNILLDEPMLQKIIVTNGTFKKHYLLWGN